MTEHLIRLRGGWRLAFEPDDGEPPTPLTLPTHWYGGRPRRVRLTRSFQAPPLDLRRETLWLRLAHTPGLTAARLNGRPLDPPAGDHPVEPGHLLDRNFLELEVDPPDGATPAPDGGWGQIALIVRRDEAVDGPARLG